MRAAIVHPLGIRGIARYCHNLANAVVPHVDRCEFVTSTLFEKENLPRRYELVPAFRLWDVGARDNRKRTLAERLLRPAELVSRFVRFETSWRRAVRHVVDAGGGVVHLHETLFPWEARHVLGLRRAGARLVVTCHNVEALSSRVGQAGGDRSEMRDAMGRIYAASDAVILHSRTNVVEFARLYPEVADRTHVIHHGCEPEPVPTPAKRSEARSALGIEDHQVLVICFGEVKPYKGIEFLLDAVIRMSNEVADLRVVVAGLPTDPGYAARLKTQHDASATLKNTVRLDFRYLPWADVQRLFTAADLAVLPYRSVYQSGVLAQALSHGLPVIVTDVGGLGETVRHTGAGLVAPATDASSLAIHLSSLVGDPAARSRHGQAARTAAAGELSWDAAGQATAELYRKIVGD